MITHSYNENGNFALEYFLNQDSETYKQRLANIIQAQLKFQKNNEKIPGGDQTPFEKAKADLFSNTSLFISQRIANKNLSGIEHLDYAASVQLLINNFALSEKNARIILTCEHQAAIQNYNFKQLQTLIQRRKSPLAQDYLLLPFTFYTQAENGNLICHSYVINFPQIGKNDELPEATRTALIDYLLALNQAKIAKTPLPINTKFSILIDESYEINFSETDEKVTIGNYKRDNSYEFEQFCENYFEFDELAKISVEKQPNAVAAKFNFKLDDNSKNLIFAAVADYKQLQDDGLEQERKFLGNYYFNQLSAAEYLSIVKGSFDSYLNFNRANYAAASQTEDFQYHAYNNTKQHFKDFAIKIVWIQNSLDQKKALCFTNRPTPFSRKNSSEESEKMVNKVESTEKLAQTISKDYSISYENALLIVRFRTEHMGCLVNQSVRFVNSVEEKFYGSRYLRGYDTVMTTYGLKEWVNYKNQKFTIDFFKENEMGQLIYESYLIDKSSIKSAQDASALIVRLQAGIKIEENDPHVLSFQSFTMTGVAGQAIPKLSNYSRFDTKRFEIRKEKLFDYSDSYNQNFATHLSNIRHRPVSRDQSLVTFDHLLKERLQSINSPHQLIAIFKDIPSNWNLMHSIAQIKTILNGSNAFEKKKQLTQWFNEYLNRDERYFMEVVYADLKDYLNLHYSNVLNQFDDLEVKNALYFSYFYEVIIQNIVKALDGIELNEIKLLRSISIEYFNSRKNISKNILTVEYLKQVANYITPVPTKVDDCATYAATVAAIAVELNTLVHHSKVNVEKFFRKLNRVFNYFPAQKDFKSELVQFNQIITNLNDGEKFPKPDDFRFQIELTNFLEGKDSSLSLTWKKTILELRSFLKQMLIDARNNLFDPLGNLHLEIKACLEKTYGCNIDLWIAQFGKEKINQALFNSYFANLYGIFQQQLAITLSFNDNKFEVFCWLFDKLAENIDHSAIIYPTPIKQISTYNKPKTLNEVSGTQLKQSSTENNRVDDTIMQVNSQLHDIQVNFNNSAQINPAANNYQQDDHTRILLNQTRDLYRAQLGWQQTKSNSLNQASIANVTQVYDAAIERVQQQQGSIQKLLFLGKESKLSTSKSPPRQHLIDQLACILDLNQKSQLFSDADSVIAMAKVNMEQNQSNFINEITHIGDGLENIALRCRINKFFISSRTSEEIFSNLRNVWDITKNEKPSFMTACFNSVLRKLGWYDGDVNGIDEREYLNQIRKKIKAFLIHIEFKQSVVNVINHFCSGKISQYEVVPLLKQIIRHYEPYLLGELEQLNTFCDCFSELVEQHAKLYDDVQTPKKLVIPNDDQPVQQNLPPDPDTDLAPFKQTIQHNIQPLTARHCYQSALWRSTPINGGIASSDKSNSLPQWSSRM